MPSIPGKGRIVRRSAAAVLAGPALLVPILVQQASASPSPTGLAHRNIPVCGTPAAGSAACDVILHQLVTRDGKPAPVPTGPPSDAYTPADILAAYNWGSLSGSASTLGTGKTIGIVDAYDDPTIVNDLKSFSDNWPLPSYTATTSTTSASGSSSECGTVDNPGTYTFKKVNQDGNASPLPHQNGGWAMEISLDVEWAHAIAPCANIVLVEAKSSTIPNLGAAEITAAGLASYVSNSWGGPDSPNDTAYDANYFHANVSYFASAGDTSGAVNYPAASPNVLAVGGTTLCGPGSPDSMACAASAWTETAWSDSGGGCSTNETATSAQSTFLSGSSPCPAGDRAIPDVALDANPATGVAIYDSTKTQGQAGWFTVGGTSVGSPIWAARSADTASPVDATTVYPASASDYPSASNITYRDTLIGSNGNSALPSYDLVTGLGSWASGAPAASAPAAVTGLSDQVNGSDVTLSWSGTVPTSGYFNVYRSTSATMSNAVAVGCSGTTTDSCTDPGLSAGTYYYAVTSVDANGVLSAVTTTSSGVAVGGGGSGSSLTVTVVPGNVVPRGPNFSVPITVDVANSSGPVSGAGVTLNIYGPSPTPSSCPPSPSTTPAATGSATTASTGEVTFGFRARSSGEWCAVADATAGTATGSGASEFTT